MRQGIVGGAAALVVFGGLLALAASQPAQDDGNSSGIPRLPGTSHPDLNGVWQAFSEAEHDLEGQAAQAAALLHPGVPNGNPVPHAPVLALGALGGVPPSTGVVAGGTIPYRPEALEQKQENFANRLTLDPAVKCYLPGVPRATYMPFPFQIVQSARHTMMVHGYAGAVRTIYMDDHIDAPADSWMGWSNGHWEGDTLVVDTTGFNGMTWFDRAGNFHSAALHVVERFTPRSAETLMYEVTIEDPNVFTRPWTMSMPLYRRVEPNAEVLEFRCVEFVEDLMYGDLRKQTE